MYALEDCECAVIFQFQEVQKLQPQVFQLVRVIFEQFKIVANRAKNFVKLWLKFAVALHNEIVVLVDKLTFLIFCSRRDRDFASWLVLGYLNYQAVFLSVFLELVLNGTYNIFNFVAEQFKKNFGRYFLSLLLLIVNLLTVEQLGYRSVLVLELYHWLAIIQIYKHVSQIGAKLCFHVRHLLVSLLALILVGRLRLCLLKLSGLSSLVFLPLGIFSLDNFSFGKRFIGKLTIVFFLFVVIVFLFFLILLLFGVPVVATFFIVDTFLFEVVLTWVSICLLLMRSNDLVHSYHSLVKIRWVTISISHYF